MKWLSGPHRRAGRSQNPQAGRPVWVRLNAGLCRCFTRHFPARKYQHPGVTPEGAGENLGAFNARANATILDCRDSGLRNSGCLSQLILAQFLKLAEDAHRLANRYDCTLLRRTIVFHYCLR